MDRLSQYENDTTNLLTTNQMYSDLEQLKMIKSTAEYNWHRYTREYLHYPKGIVRKTLEIKAIDAYLAMIHFEKSIKQLNQELI